MMNRFYRNSHARRFEQPAGKSEKRSKRDVAAQVKAMALVLTVAFLVAATASVLVSSLAKSYTDQSRANATAVRVEKNGPQAKLMDTAAHRLSERAETPICIRTGSPDGNHDWKYSGDSDCAAIDCTYNSSANQYIFTAKGIHPGAGHLELMYQTGDTWGVTNVAVTVDSSLNVTATSC